jgi:hypothetical protein
MIPIRHHVYGSCEGFHCNGSISNVARTLFVILHRLNIASYDVISVLVIPEYKLRKFGERWYKNIMKDQV